MRTCSLTSSLVLALGSIVLVVAGRWLWFAPLGDYGWTYEAACRISWGEVQYRDFISTWPPLAHYSLAALISLFGNSLWLWSLDAHLWWAISLGVGAMVGREMGMRPRLLVGSLVLAASFSFPAAMGANSYNYAATSAAGVAALYVLRHQGSGHWGHATAAGFVSGVCVLVKINVALAVGTGAGIALLLSLTSRREPPVAYLRGAAGFLFGWLLGFLPLLLYFVVQAGFEEVYLQMFRDAAASKGGILQVIGRAAPRVVFHAELPHRRLIELGVSALLIGAFFFYGNAVFTSRQRGKAREGMASAGDAALARVAALYFAILVGFSVASLFDLPGVRKLGTAIQSFEVVPSPFLLAVQLLYAGSMTCCLVLAVRPSSWRAPALALPLVFVSAISFGHAMSSVNQVASAAPVTVPLLFHLLERSGWYPSGERAGWALGAVSLSLALLFSPYAATFERLVRMPDGGPFSGLYGMPFYRDLTETLLSNVAPRIQGRRTLWLVSGGPHCAFGGRPVPGVAIFYEDTHAPRSEPILREEWSRNPPEFVVLGEFSTADGAEFLTPSGLREWLERDYTRVWEDREPIEPGPHGAIWSKPLSLWKKN